jgi:AbrB family looped-hinge helix DNA binding protein
MSHDSVLVKISDNGRLSIPARYRKQLGLEPGDTLVARVEDGGLRLQPIRRVITDLQDRVARFAADSENGVDWLLQERRREAAEDGLVEQETREPAHSDGA